MLNDALKDKSIKKRGDYSIIFAVILLSLIGLIFIYSASRYSAESTYGDKFFFVKKQFIGIVLGLFTMILTCNYKYDKLKKLNIPIIIISIILLVLVFVPNIGVENYGAKRWIGVGGITLQPSEIAKFSFILFSAAYISSNPETTRKFIGLLPIIMYGIIICMLIIAEPNMSITVCVALLMMTMMFAAGMRIRHFFTLIIPAVIFGVILIISEPYRLNRLDAFINPWSSPKGEGYQLLQSLYALGSGGFFGVGFFSSRQKYAFLPFAESDFILSVIGEETGYFGIVLLFILLFFIIYRGFKIAVNSKDIFGFMLATGITMIFGIQVLVNALVVSGSIPPTGLPLPLVSSGNTSIIIFMAEFGILFNISKTSN